jgi:hypothetical protein
VSVNKRIVRRRCSLCHVATVQSRLTSLVWHWDRDLDQEQLLCPTCVYEVPAEVLADVPHEWRPVLAA